MGVTALSRAMGAPRAPPGSRSIQERKETIMLTVGDRLPEFKLTAAVSLEKNKEFAELTNESFPGAWSYFQGALFVFIILLLPGGLASLTEKIGGRPRRVGS